MDRLTALSFLRGESPATIPVHVLRNWGVAVNRTTARALGVEIPPAIMIRANKVFE